MTLQTPVLFDGHGHPTEYCGDSSTANAAIRVCILSRTQAIADADKLRPDVESLFALVLSGNSAAATSLADEIFEAKETTEETEEAAGGTQIRSFVFLAYHGSDTHESELVGFARVSYRAYFDAIVGSPLMVDLELDREQRKALQLALFHATQSVGEALTTELLVEKREKASKNAESEELLPTSQLFWRGLFNSTDFTRQLFADNGFYEEMSRIEMSKSVTYNDHGIGIQDQTFPSELEVKTIDLSDHAGLSAVYEMLKFVFGPDPPCFDAWKLHYAQQPRFASELSFVAWKIAPRVPVAVALVERLVDGEGGGDDELEPLYATHGKLQAQKRAVESGAPLEEEDADLQQLLSKISSSALIFSADFAEKKKRIVREATTAYICGVATNPAYRGRGLAGKLLRLIFREAAKSPPLQEIVLTVAASNTSAVRAYDRAGMIEKKRYSSGFHIVKQISLAQP